MSKINFPCVLTRIKDGDTLCVRIDCKLPFANLSIEIAVRLEGVGAREIRSKNVVEKLLGHEDKIRLINLVEIGSQYLLEVDFPPSMTLDRFVGRLKTLDGVDINSKLIELGTPCYDRTNL